MKLLYLTERLPFGTGEAFLYPEIEELVSLGVDLRVLPTFPNQRDVFHTEAQAVMPHLFGPNQGFGLGPAQLMSGSCKPHTEAQAVIPHLIDLNQGSGLASFPFKALWTNFRALFAKGSPYENLKKFIKNADLILGSSRIASSVTAWRPDHIHAQWANYPATLAWALARSLNIPWSFTAHRYDILYNNLFGMKAASAAFVRFISKAGMVAANRYGYLPKGTKATVLHLGVELPDHRPAPARWQEKFEIVVPAGLSARKGHLVLIKALSLMPDSVISEVKVHFYGDGPFRSTIEREISERHLNSTVELHGALPHDQLLRKYESGSVHCVVLPTLDAGQGLGEGIPVSLMEAMAYGIPVIATRTGGTPELIVEGAGILVPPSNSELLCEAILRVIQDKEGAALLSQGGYEQIANEFSARASAKGLLELIAADGNDGCAS